MMRPWYAFSSEFFPIYAHTKCACLAKVADAARNTASQLFAFYAAYQGRIICRLPDAVAFCLQFRFLCLLRKRRISTPAPENSLKGAGKQPKIDQDSKSERKKSPSRHVPGTAARTIARMPALIGSD